MVLIIEKYRLFIQSEKLQACFFKISLRNLGKVSKLKNVFACMFNQRSRKLTAVVSREILRSVPY